MKNSVSVCISIFISLLVVFLVVSFRTSPSSQIWKGYKTLYVSNELKSSVVEAILNESGIHDAITKNSQKQPVVSRFAPVQFQGSSSYLLRREGFFTDKSGKFNVFYIPENEASRLSGVLSKLNKSNVKCGLDGEGKKSILPSLIALLAFAAVLFFSENKIAFASVSIFQLIFAFANPFYSVSAAVVLSFFASYMVQKIYMRNGSFKRISSFPLFYFFALVPGLVLAFSYIKLMFFYFLCVIASCTGFYSFVALKAFFEEKMYSFAPVYILGSSFVKLPGKEGLKILETLLVSMVVLISLSFLGGGLASAMTPVSSSENLALPSPVSSVKSDALPDCEDLSVWAWHTLTFPFRTFDKNNFEYKKPEEGEKFAFQGITQVRDANIELSLNDFVYNSSFRQGIFRTVEKASYPALEKMMLKQGEKSRFAYAKSSGSAQERFKLVILLLLASGTLLVTIYYLFKKY